MTDFRGPLWNSAFGRDVLVTYDLDKNHRNYPGIKEYLDAQSARKLTESCYHIKSGKSNDQILQDLCKIGDLGDTFVVADYAPMSERARNSSTRSIAELLMAGSSHATNK
ncbi:hypothetical protein [Devosia sp. MC1541]|uniref:hypothetical protein n=1 Tax=Devosia sp. MC1541 TaxID=2725264 RepID=UPI00145F7415|nr:hypothetical protein [Devosia sp. MC1541]